MRALFILIGCLAAVGAHITGEFFKNEYDSGCQAPASGIPQNASALPAACIPGSCTIFTVSMGDVVLFGNNEDYINPKTYYWTVPSKEGQYGGVFFGFDNYWPQGGINEKGLAYDINALPTVALAPRARRRKVENPVYEILQTCATVAEAADLAGRLDWGDNVSGQIHFADASGEAVVISAGPEGEIAYTRKSHGDGFLVSTNFNRANPGNGWYPCARYTKASAMLAAMQKQGVMSVAACADILDEVHQEGPGNNTLYSNIYDLKQRKIYLFHWHQFQEVVELDVAEEIAKTEPPRRIRDLFSRETVQKAVAEYQAYRNAETPEP